MARLPVYDKPSSQELCFILGIDNVPLDSTRMHREPK